MHSDIIDVESWIKLLRFTRKSWRSSRAMRRLCTIWGS
ncbi:hypothetical protein GRAN_3872 [Granulicella sibirica]|uniref:Uncharacterized protein n=1 Tax=Granulicella sibirica TaxID=2479048 RepID=A0A4Q0SYR2_9BACT|nr:hypothetical protein GRAN_3872 [Granulicella sibirica]